MTRRIVARVLLAICAVGALISAVSAVGAVTSADDATVLAEVWRGYGFLVFAGLFALLAYRPDTHPAVWALVLFHKVAMALTTLAFLDAPDAATIAVADGVVSVLLIAAYLLVRPARAGVNPWNRSSPLSASR